MHICIYICMCVYIYMYVYIRMYISIKPAADDLPGKTPRALVSRHRSQKYSDIRYYDLDCSDSTCSGQMFAFQPSIDPTQMFSRTPLLYTPPPPTLLVYAGSKQHLQQAVNS